MDDRARYDGGESVDHMPAVRASRSGARPSDTPRQARGAPPSGRRASPRLRERLRLATSEAILQAAEQTIVEHGLDGVCIGHIAERAGVAVGTLYNHFRDRDALLEALMRLRRQELLGRVSETLERHRAASFDGRLRALADTFFAHFDEHRQLLRILLDEHAACAAPVKNRDQLHGRVERLMKAGLRGGALDRDHGASFYASLFMSMIKAALIELGDDSNARSTMQLADGVTRIFLRGAAARGRSRPARALRER